MATMKTNKSTKWYFSKHFSPLSMSSKYQLYLLLHLLENKRNAKLVISNRCARNEAVRLDTLIHSLCTPCNIGNGNYKDKSTKYYFSNHFLLLTASSKYQLYFLLPLLENKRNSNLVTSNRCARSEASESESVLYKVKISK